MPGRGRYWKQGGLNDSIITSAEIVDGTISTEDIANAAVTAVKSKIFTSTIQTANASAQNVAHGLGAVPTKVLVIPTKDTGGGTLTITEGTHTSTNVVVTVAPSGIEYKVWAMV